MKKEEVIDAMQRSRFRNQAINRITWRMGYDLSRKEEVRALLNELKDKDIVSTVDFEGVKKWVLHPSFRTPSSRIYIKSKL